MSIDKLPSAGHSPTHEKLKNEKIRIQSEALDSLENNSTEESEALIRCAAQNSPKTSKTKEKTEPHKIKPQEKPPQIIWHKLMLEQ